MNAPMKILIVEDDPIFSEVVMRLVEPILNAFPGSTVVVVRTIERALEEVAAMNAPDITLLDLTLPPSGVVETLSHLDTLENRTAVVILTGQKEELVKKLLGSRNTPVVEKTTDMISSGRSSLLMRAIEFAVDSYQKRAWGQARANLAILRNVTVAHATQG